MDFYEIADDVHSYLQNIESMNIDVGWGKEDIVPEKYSFEWDQAMWHCAKAKDYIDRICYSTEDNESDAGDKEDG